MALTLMLSQRFLALVPAAHKTGQDEGPFSPSPASKSAHPHPSRPPPFCHSTCTHLLPSLIAPPVCCAFSIPCSTLIISHVHTGQASASYVQWSETPLPDTHQRVGSSVPLPTAAEWHTSDASLPSPSSLSLLYPSSPESPSTSATSPPSSSRASSPSVSIPGSPRPQRKTASRRSAKDPSHIPRPRNPFILYRSEVCERLRRTNVENDHRKISQIIGDMWRKEPATVRQHYKIMAAREKEEHARLYPHYRFTPQARAVPPKKRNVKRNGEIDRQRCKLIAEILQKGDSNNQKLEQEVNDFDRRRQEEIMRRAAYETGDPYTTTVFNVWGSPSTSPLSSPSSGSPSGETPFRSPLLPPATPPSASASPDTAIEDACNSLAPLQLGPGPEESYNVSSTSSISHSFQSSS